MKAPTEPRTRIAAGHSAIVYGALGAFSTGLVMIYCFAFANLVNPDLHGMARFWLVLSRLYELPWPGVMTLPTSIVLLVSCCHFVRGIYWTTSAFFGSSRGDSEHGVDHK